jgi:hypothetical protein
MWRVRMPVVPQSGSGSRARPALIVTTNVCRSAVRRRPPRDAGSSPRPGARQPAGCVRWSARSRSASTSRAARTTATELRKVRGCFTTQPADPKTIRYVPAPTRSSVVAMSSSTTRSASGSITQRRCARNTRPSGSGGMVPDSPMFPAGAARCRAPRSRARRCQDPAHGDRFLEPRETSTLPERKLDGSSRCLLLEDQPRPPASRRLSGRRRSQIVVRRPTSPPAPRRQ